MKTLAVNAVIAGRPAAAKPTPRPGLGGMGVMRLVFVLLAILLLNTLVLVGAYALMTLAVG